MRLLLINPTEAILVSLEISWTKKMMNCFPVPGRAGASWLNPALLFYGTAPTVDTNMGSMKAAPSKT